MAPKKAIDILNFRECVGEFIGFDKEKGRANNPDRLSLLAGVFEVAHTTVERWATGISNPHPVIKQDIMSFVNHVLSAGRKFRK